uniref:WW domain-containing protein n=1 Tax=Ursus americanus TaxID=9643 RepID=A0A452SJS1_URSAM
MRVQDTSGTYYWHIPTGTTQWEPPGRASPSQGSSPQEESQLTWTGFAHREGFEDGEFWKVRGPVLQWGSCRRGIILALTPLSPSQG